MAEVLNVLLRWLHLASMATLIGGVLYGRFVAMRAIELLPDQSRGATAERAASLFRPFVFAAMAGLLISGLYAVVSAPGHTARYHALLGIKLLLVAHVFAVAILIVRPESPRRGRLMVGAAVSGLAIVMISAYLRRIF